VFRPQADVYLDRLAENYRYLQGLVGEAAILAVVKADAYGHGIRKIAQSLDKEGIFGFAVALQSEVETLLDAGIQRPILHLGKVHPGLIVSCESRQVRCTINCLDDIRMIEDRNGFDHPVKVHLKVDTGMNRMGLPLKWLDDALDRIRHSSRVELEGLWTHLATAEEEDTEFLNYQLDQFDRVIGDVKRTKLPVRYFHAGNSAALLRHPRAHYNMVRPGVALFGVSPYRVVNPNLKPVMAFRAPLVLKKEISAGQFVGYNRKFIAEKSDVFGVIQAGYADGMPACLSNGGSVFFSNQLLPVVGKVSMDMTSIRLSDTPIQIGDLVTIWGGDHVKNRIESLSEYFRKLPYEFLTTVSKRVHRIYHTDSLQ